MDKQQNRQALFGYLFAIGSTAIWSGNFIIARALNGSIPPVSLAFWRWLVAVLVILPFAWKSFIAEWDIVRKNLPYLALAALLGVTAFNTLVYFAGRTTTALNIGLISVTFPVFIVFFSWVFFKEAITFNKGVGILLVLAGVVFLVTKGSLARLLGISFALGDLWALLAAIDFAVYSILLKHKPKGLGLWAFQLSAFFLGFLFLVPFFIWETLTNPPVVFDAKIILSILYVGIFASFAAFLFWSKAVAALGPARAGMVYYTLPAFSGILAFALLGETITPTYVFSVLLIAAGIVTANRTGAKPSEV